MRWPLWRSAESDSDALDPELLSLFASSARLPEVGVSDLARGRARVDAHLSPETPSPVAGGWFRRRFAWAAAGGGSLWAAVMGTAFASNASTAAVGLTILLAGAGTAEVTGIGPAVRESLGISQPGANSNASDQGIEAQNNGLGVENENANEQASDVSPSEDTPGNLVTNVRPNGTFSLRGILEGDSVIEVVIPGQNNPNADAPDLSEYNGYLVLVTGTCVDFDEEDFNLLTDCTVESVSILGRAGQGQPENPGKPEELPGQVPEDAGPPSLHTTGKPADTPGGNPNSD